MNSGNNKSAEKVDKPIKLSTILNGFAGSQYTSENKVKATFHIDNSKAEIFAVIV